MTFEHFERQRLFAANEIICILLRSVLVCRFNFGIEMKPQKYDSFGNGVYTFNSSGCTTESMKM